MCFNQPRVCGILNRSWIDSSRLAPAARCAGAFCRYDNAFNYMWCYSDTAGSLFRATEPRYTPVRTANPHNHIEIVAVHDRQVRHRHAAHGANGVRVDTTETRILCEHHCIAGSTPYDSTFVFFAMPTARHAEHDGPDRLCNAIILFATP
jgi:hypothetical protein